MKVLRFVWVLSLLSGLLLAAAFIGGAAGSVAARAPAVTRFYVDGDAPGAIHDGLSWSTAYTTVQPALAWASIYSMTTYEIWVAEGVYYPDEGGSHVNNSPNEAFRLEWDNVRLYGGFAGTETLRSQRDWTVHPAILSGDIDKNDSNNDGNFVAESWNDLQGNNAWHVVYLNGDVNPAITENTVIDGFIITAGNADDASPNNAGGGLHCRGGGTDHGCSPTISNVTFSGNQATGPGGGMYSTGSNGGVVNPVLTDVFFRGNFSQHGGAMYNDGSVGGTARALLTRVVFTGNQAQQGGAMYNLTAAPTLIHVALSGNVASYYGGGMYNHTSSHPMLIDVLFSGNATLYYGGGMYNNGSSNPTVINSTFSGNLAANSGGGIYNSSSSSPQVRNSILWGDGGGEIATASGTPLVSYSDIQGGCPAGASCGSGMLNVDPSFVAPVASGGAPTTAGNYRLTAGSPAINAGDNSFITLTTDLAGRDRLIQRTVDLGAYEAAPLYVDRDATGAGDGSSWADAFPRLQSALDLANANGSLLYEIWVAEGTYYPDEGGSHIGNALTESFTLKWNNVRLYGGFAGTEISRLQRMVGNYPVVLSGDLNQDGTLTGNAYHVLYLDGVTQQSITPTTILDGLIVASGNAAFSSPYDAGGGLYCAGNGSGKSCSPTVSNVIFRGNQAAYGGAMYNNGNTGNSSPALINVLFSGNHAGSMGGAMYNNGSTSGTSNPVLTNVTFSGNRADTSGGGMYNYGPGGSCHPLVVNGIHWGNYASADSEIANVGATATISYSDIQGSCPSGATCGSGMLYVDPKFVTPISATLAPVVTGNYHLNYTSPVIDVGNSVSATAATDLDGRPRIMRGGVDMGAYEFDIVLAVSLAGTGSGTVTSNPAGINCGGACAAVFPSDSIVSLTAAPATGSTFAGWSGDVVSSANPITVLMDTSHNVTAIFNIKTFVITPTAGANGTITPTGPQIVTYGSSPVFTIMPDVGYHTVDVGVDGISQGALISYTFNNITANHTITAAFALNSYIITPTAGVSGTITPSTPQVVLYGGSRAFTVAANTGCHIVDVGVDGASMGALTAYTFTDVTSDHTITATFAVNTYTLTTFVVGQGQVTRSPSQTVYSHGQVVVLTATPALNWYFGQWSGDAAGVLTRTQITMDRNKIVTATFLSSAPVSYTLTMHLVGSGVVTPGVGTHGYLSGTVVDLSAGSVGGWTFVGWTGDVTGTLNPAQLMMNGNKEVTATFRLKVFLPVVTRNQK